MKEGVKFDNGKTEWGLIPWGALEHSVKVLMFGAKKYTKDGWKSVTPKERYIEAAFRHLIAYQSGEKKDPESGISHLAHVICCLLFKIWDDDNKDNLNTGEKEREQMD